MSRLNPSIFKNTLPFEMLGEIEEACGVLLKAKIPGVAVGDLVRIDSGGWQQLALVRGFSGPTATLVPIDGVEQIRFSAAVSSLGNSFSVKIPENPLGLTLSAMGEVLIGRSSEKRVEVNPAAKPLAFTARATRKERFDTGIRAIDGVLTTAIGQRLLLAAEPGVGKTTLLSQLAKNNSADAVVVALVGERGREANEFTQDVGSHSNIVTVVSTSDESAFRRMLSGKTAFSVAEHLAAKGLNVVLLFDSLTRYVRSVRDLALSSGEPPIRRGYPASVFADFPALLERAGRFRKGSITAFFTMLLTTELEEDPMIEEVRGILDGHIILRREIAERGIYPAISISESLSRLANDVQSQEERRDGRLIRKMFARLKKDREIGYFSERLDTELAVAIELEKDLEGYLSQEEVICAEDCRNDTRRLADKIRNRLDRSKTAAL